MSNGDLLVGVNSDHADSAGLFRSTNGGTSFTRLSDAPGSGLPAGAVTDLALDPTDPMLAYAGVAGQGVFVSADGGTVWSAANTGLTNLATVSRVVFAVSPLVDSGTGNHPVFVATIGKTNVLTGGSAAGTLTLQVPANTVVEAGDTIELGGAGADGVDNDGDVLTDALDPSEAGLTERWKVTAVGPIVGGNRTLALRAANADNLDNDRDDTTDTGAETLVANRGLFNAWGPARP